MEIFHDIIYNGDSDIAKCKFCDVVILNSRLILKELGKAQAHDFDLIYDPKNSNPKNSNPKNSNLICCNEPEFIKQQKELYKRMIKERVVKEDEFINAFLQSGDEDFSI